MAFHPRQQSTRSEFYQKQTSKHFNITMSCWYRNCCSLVAKKNVSLSSNITVYAVACSYSQTFQQNGTDHNSTARHVERLHSSQDQGDSMLRVLFFLFIYFAEEAINPAGCCVYILGIAWLKQRRHSGTQRDSCYCYLHDVHCSPCLCCRAVSYGHGRLNQSQSQATVHAKDTGFRQDCYMAAITPQSILKNKTHLFL